MTSRPITPLPLNGTVPKVPDTEMPTLTWVNPRDVLVDGRYQRDLSSASRALIRRIVAEWDWRRVRPAVCAWGDDGLEAIDGQHTLIAAASHPAITKVPVIIVPAEELRDRAATFIGINRDRLNVTRTALHAAAVVAGDEAAVRIAAVCGRLGIVVRKVPPKAGSGYAPRETLAVSTIGALIARHGEAAAEAMLRVLAEAECAPIESNGIRAVELLTVDPEFAGQVEPADLAAAVAASADTVAREAKLFAATHGVPAWRGVAATWFKRARKRRPAPAASDPAAPTKPPATLGTPSRLATGRPEPGESYSFGDPVPGRSALDQRRAGA